MKQYKLHIPKYTFITYFGERVLLEYEYWTTVNGENESEAIYNGKKNLYIQIAYNEWFSKGIKTYKSVWVDSNDIEVIFVKEIG